MKIYTKIKIDIDTGQTLEEEFFEYHGPLALCITRAEKEMTDSENFSGSHSRSRKNEGDVEKVTDPNYWEGTHDPIADWKIQHEGGEMPPLPYRTGKDILPQSAKDWFIAALAPGGSMLNMLRKTLGADFRAGVQYPGGRSGPVGEGEYGEDRINRGILGGIGDGLKTAVENQAPPIIPRASYQRPPQWSVTPPNVNLTGGSNTPFTGNTAQYQMPRGFLEQLSSMPQEGLLRLIQELFQGR